MEIGLTVGQISGNINKLSHERTVETGSWDGGRMKDDFRNLLKKSLTLPLECGNILNGS